MTRTVRIVRWRGVEQECAGREDALDRWGQLDAQGINAAVVEVTADGQERPVILAANLPASRLACAGLSRVLALTPRGVQSLSRRMLRRAELP